MKTGSLSEVPDELWDRPTHLPSLNRLPKVNAVSRNRHRPDLWPAPCQGVWRAVTRVRRLPCHPARSWSRMTQDGLHSTQQRVTAAAGRVPGRARSRGRQPGSAPV